MESRLSARLGAGASAAAGDPATSGGHIGDVPGLAHEFSRAMGESLYLPAAVVLIGVVAVLFFRNPHGLREDA